MKNKFFKKIIISFIVIVLLAIGFLQLSLISTKMGEIDDLNSVSFGQSSDLKKSIEVIPLGENIKIKLIEANTGVPDGEFLQKEIAEAEMLKMVASEESLEKIIRDNLLEGVVKVALNGVVLTDDEYSYESGSVVLVVEPKRTITPGRQTLAVTITNPLTKETELIAQDFLWGVLAMNSDQDRYLVGQIGEIHFGVLDDEGNPVCDASLELIIKNQELGINDALSTKNGTIVNTGNCENLEVGNIIPDYKAFYTFGEAGDYVFDLIVEIDKWRIHYS